MPGKDNGTSDCSKLIVSAIHKRMFERLNHPLADMARQKISEGKRPCEMIGVIMDLDDPIWRVHIEMGPTVAPPGPPNPFGTVKRAFFGIVRRREIQHIIDMLPSFESFFTQPPLIGFIPVLVLASGMASPFTIHWGAELELEWEE